MSARAGIGLVWFPPPRPTLGLKVKLQTFVSHGEISPRMVSYRRASFGALPVPKVYSLSEDLTNYSKHQLNTLPCQRTGIMAAFHSFEQFER